MVRSMCKNDIPQVAKMLEDLHTMHCAHVPDVFSAYPFEHFKQEAVKIFKDRQQIKLVFELDGCPVGMCAVVLRDASRGRIGEIHALYVRVDCRRRGIGTELLQNMLNALQAKGVYSVRLNVWAFNAPAQALYKKAGFQTAFETMLLKLQ